MPESRGAIIESAGRLKRGLGRSRPTPGTGPSNIPLEIQYRRWRLAVEADARTLALMSTVVSAGAEAPSMVFLVPGKPGQAAAVGETLESLETQAYPRWRAATFDDVFSAPAPAPSRRVALAPRDPEQSWSMLLVAAAAPRADEYICVLEPGERVTAHGLVEVARALLPAPRCDLIYTDWDELDDQGGRSQPHFEYGWSPELLVGRDYLKGMVLQRCDLIEATNWWRAEDAPAEIYAQRLRASGRVHDPRHLSVIGLSRAPGGSEDPGVAVRRPRLEAWLASRGEQAHVETGREPGMTDVRWALTSTPQVDIVIPTRDRVDLLRRCLESLEASTYPHRRVLIVDNGSHEEATAAYLAGQPHRVLRHPGEFNYSAIVNHAARECDAPYLVLLNNDTVVSTPGWLEAMLGWCQRGGIGAVGARLLFADGRVQHEGVGIGIGRVAANLDLGWSATRACSAVTAACLMVRREAFEVVGGFDEDLHVAFGDVDFCLRLWRAGWRVVVTPLAELRHDEGSSRGSLTPEVDYVTFCRRWGEETRLRDAFLGPHVAWPQPLTLRIPGRG